MPETAAGNLLDGLAAAIEDGDALRARRRLGELDSLIGRLPAPALVAVQSRLASLKAEAERLRTNLQASLEERHTQRRSIDAYRRIAGQI